MKATACDACLRRSRLVADLSGHLDVAWRAGAAVEALLALSDDDLIAAITAGAGPRAFDPTAERAAAARAGVAPVCRHDPGYPDRLTGIAYAPPAVHVAGDEGRLRTLVEGATVGIVGARRATDYGLEVAHALGRDLASAGVTVVSGMALGVDAAAHTGALDAGGPTLAVLGGGPDRPYPASKRGLHRRLLAEHCVISELPAGTQARRWCFPARNRIIAALADATIVIEAATRSGALITARLARDLGREVAAVPGRVTSPHAQGTNALLYDGAALVRDAQDVLDLVFGVGAVAAQRREAPSLDSELQGLLDAVAGGRDTVGALTLEPGRTDAVLAGLAELELLGLVHRGAGGRYVAVT